MTAARVEEVRLGGRNFVRAGDTVKVLRSERPRESGFRARFMYAEVDDAGTPTVLVVWGAPGRKAPCVRSLRPERVRRMAQTRGGERREALR